METKKKLGPVVTELFVRGRILNIWLVFISQSKFILPKEIRPNVTHYFIMKIFNKGELQPTLLNRPSDIEFKGFIDSCRVKTYIYHSHFFLLFFEIIIIECIL